MSKRVRVFVSSPYSIGDVEANVQVQINALDDLLNLGFSPFIPLLFHYAKKRPYQDWIDLDLDWLDLCDCVLRLPGPSEGADDEVARANQLGIPVVHSINELIELYLVKRS